MCGGKLRVFLFPYASVLARKRSIFLTSTLLLSQLLKCTAASDVQDLTTQLSKNLGHIDTPIDIQGQTLLHLAVIYANPLVVSALLSAGANAAATDA